MKIRAVAGGGIMPEELFYIATKNHEALWPRKMTSAKGRKTFVGVVLWWAPNSEGYSTFLDGAGKYTREEAEGIVSRRGGDFMVPCAVAEASTVRVVDIDKFKELTGESPYA
jgi:hypothetical protein